jgi:hypothetical protein
MNRTTLTPRRLHVHYMNKKQCITSITEIYEVTLLPQGSASEQENNGQVLYRFYQEHLKGCRPHRQVYQPEPH